MKTLRNQKNEEEILSRLENIHPTSLRRWGKMTAHQMIRHLNDGFELYMGRLSVRDPGFPYPSRILKFGSLWVPIPWLRGFRTPPEIDQEGKSLAPDEFERDVDELKRLVKEFSRTAKDFQRPSHPYLGKMSEAEWKRLGYLHTDHHLRQFGA
jgi:DinB superfamily